MLKRYLPFLVILAIMIACRKDKLETRPSIKIKSVSSIEVPVGEDLRIVLEYLDKEGDLGNGTVTYIRNRLNVQFPATNTIVDTVRATLPDFPKTSTGEIDLDLTHNFLSRNPVANDTFQFKIVVTDVAGNVSDTISTPTIVEIEN